jgi:hypothetical protein
VSPAKAGEDLKNNVIQGWRAETALTPGYYLSRLRREELARLRREEPARSVGSGRDSLDHVVRKTIHETH